MSQRFPPAATAHKQFSPSGQAYVQRRLKQIHAVDAKKADKALAEAVEHAITTSSSEEEVTDVTSFTSRVKQYLALAGYVIAPALSLAAAYLHPQYPDGSFDEFRLQPVNLQSSISLSNATLPTFSGGTAIPPKFGRKSNRKSRKGMKGKKGKSTSRK